jgi:D-2-hydroxyacid dehydrogenase (NADP+)
MFPELRQSPVRMANAGGLYSPAIAEHVVMLILALFRNLPAYIRWQDEARWNPEALHFRLLQGATVGHLGTGSISQHTARLCAALGCRNRGFSRSGRPVEPFDEVVGERGLPELLRASDVVVNALPYTPETHHLMDAARFKMMKCDAIFINVGRGATVDEAALVEALENGTIAGAGLDVFEREPLPPESRLWRMPNVIVTSHRSGMGIDEDNALFDILVENLSRLESGKPLLNEVDKERGY